VRHPTSSNTDSRAAAEPPGTVIADRYEIVELLGEGMSGRVYRARQIGLDRDIAVKVLHPHRSQDTRFVERFRAEAKIASRLQTPHSAAIYDYGQHNESLYLAMQLIDGRLLEDVLGEGAQSVARACNLAAQIATGLAAIHKVSIVHADLKPGNAVLVDDPDTGQERVVLIDFGIARSEDAEHAPVVDEEGREIVSGTPGYVAPEVIRGGAPVAASDVYACGVLLYELLVGEPPFDGESLEVVRRHAFDARPIPSEHAPGLPDELDEICTAAMAIAPEDRPTARALRDQLYEVLRGLSVVVANPLLIARPIPEIQTVEPEPVGHDRAVSALVEVLSGRAEPGASLVGIAGSGRTAAVRRACERLPDGGARVLWIDGHPSGEPVPLAPIRSLLSWLTRGATLGDPGIAHDELAALLAKSIGDAGSLVGLLDLLDADELLPGLDDAERHAIQARSVSAALNGLAGRYDAVVFDNVETYDDTTRRVLHTIARRDLARLRLLFVTHPADDVAPNWRRVELEPLAAADVSALVAGVTGSLAEADTVVALAEFSRGNPSRLIQAATHFAETGAVPASEDAVLSHRLESLSPDGRALVGLMAVSGPRVRSEWLEAVAVAHDSFGSRVDELVLAGLIRRERDWLAFVDRAVRDAVYRQLDPGEAAALHGHVASVDDDQPDLVRGRHFARAGRADQAARLLCRAGIEAAVRGEGGAISILEQALQQAAALRAQGLADEARAVAVSGGAELVCALCQAGNVERARAALTTLRTRFGVGTPGTPVSTRMVQAWALVTDANGDSDRAIAVVDRHLRALAGTDRADDYLRQALLCARLRRVADGPSAAARELHRRATAVAGNPSMLAASCALRIRASRCALAAGNAAFAVREAESACAAAAGAGNAGLSWASRRALSLALEHSGENAAAERQSGRAAAALADVAASSTDRRA